MKTILTLTQDAYITSESEPGYCDMGHTHYRASAEDREGNEYEVIWECYEDHEDFDDESNCCDWESPAAIYKDGEQLSCDEMHNYELSL